MFSSHVNWPILGQKIRAAQTRFPMHFEVSALHMTKNLGSNCNGFLQLPKSKNSSNEINFWSLNYAKFKVVKKLKLVSRQSPELLKTKNVANLEGPKFQLWWIFEVQISINFGFTPFERVERPKFQFEWKLCLQNGPKFDFYPIFNNEICNLANFGEAKVAIFEWKLCLQNGPKLIFEIFWQKCLGLYP